MKRFLIPLVSSLLLFSCGEEKTILHTGNSGADFETAMLGNKFTIFYYIDSTDCDPCAMQWLFRWIYFEEELKKLNTGVVLIVRSSNKEVIYETMEQMRLDFPVVFDKASTIKQNNAAILEQHPVFAVNNKKEVIWLGLPIADEDTWNKFCKTLRQKSKRN